MTSGYRRILAIGAFLTLLQLGGVAGQQRGGGAVHIVAQKQSTNYLTGRAFRDALAVQVRVRWENVPLRHALYRLTHEQGLALVLDRRIDPSAPVRIATVGQTRREILATLAAQNGARFVVLGHVAYIAPEDATGRMAYLTQLRRKDTAALPASRRRALDKKSTLRWDDLESPEEILQRIARQYRVELEGLAGVPWDLWAGSALPETTAAEQLTTVLGQFDLTFRWRRQGEVAEIVPIAQNERTVPSSFTRPGQTTRPIASSRSTNRRRGARQSVFDGEVKNKQLGGVLKALAERSGYTFDVDWDALRNREITIDQLVSFKAENDTLEDLLHKIFDPLEVEFEISRRRVVIPVRNKP